MEVLNPNGGGSGGSQINGKLSTLVANGNSGANFTIDWGSGNLQSITLTASCTFTFTAPAYPMQLYLKITQDGTGGWVVTWPATCLFAGSVDAVITPTIGATDLVSIIYDGTNYNCAVLPNIA